MLLKKCRRVKGSAWSAKNVVKMADGEKITYIHGKLHSVLYCIICSYVDIM